jgi:hypothetical protein
MKVFMCFEIQDRIFVNHLTVALRDLDISTLIVDLQLALSDDVSDVSKLKQQTQHCDFVIIVLSKKFVESEWMMKELRAFQSLEKERGINLLLPIVIDDCKIPMDLKEKVCAKFRTPVRTQVKFRGAFDQLLLHIPKSRQIFVIMKLADQELKKAYLKIKADLEKAKLGYSLLRIDDILDSGNITDQILEHITKSEIIWADLTGETPNCYYEAGYAHALKKKMIFTIRKESDKHFDIEHYRFIEWNTIEELKKGLFKRLTSIRREEERSTRSNSPSRIQKPYRATLLKP